MSLLGNFLGRVGAQLALQVFRAVVAASAQKHETLTSRPH